MGDLLKPLCLIFCGLTLVAENLQVERLSLTEFPYFLGNFKDMMLHVVEEMGRLVGGNAAGAGVQYVFAWDTNNTAYGTDGHT